MINYLLASPPDLIGFLFAAIALVGSLALHEFGHAFAAHLQGDDTAKNMGRLTLNPMKHLDPVGSFMIVLAGFGWGKPVPFNPTKLRNKRFGAALVGAAGPIMNFLLAFIAGALFSMLQPVGLGRRFLLDFMLILNVLLGVFNLLPIPPLDGSRILSALLPPSRQRFIYTLDRYGFIILLIVVFFLFRPLMGPVINTVASGILRLTSHL